MPASFGLDLGGGLRHPLALSGGKDQEKWGSLQTTTRASRQLDGEHDAEGAHNGDDGDEQVLRAVVGQLRDLKQVRR